MSAVEIIFADKKESPAWRAWRQVLPLFLNGAIREGDCFHASSVNGEALSDKRRIGVAITLTANPDDFWENFIQLERVGCEFFINVTASKNNLTPWLDLEPRWRGVCMQRCSSASLKTTSLAAKIQTAIKGDFPNTRPYLRPCRPVADAKELARLLPEFSHGGAVDVTNIMLGPARMLCLAGAGEERDAAWGSWVKGSAKSRELAINKLRKFRDDLIKDPNRIDKTSSRFNALASELFESWDGLKEWFSQDEPDIQPAKVCELERMMGLLTEIRFISKGTPGNSDGAEAYEHDLQPITVSGSKSERTFRLLVVDDHASCWHGPIQLAAQGVAGDKKATIEIDFSTDGEIVIGREGDLSRWLLRYDLVLQDVYLPGGGEKGIDLLKKLRKQVNWLPVIVWTSSLSSQLAASATLHNGYLFKKTSLVEDLKKSLCYVVANWERTSALLLA